MFNTPVRSACAVLVALTAATLVVAALTAQRSAHGPTRLIAARQLGSPGQLTAIEASVRGADGVLAWRAGRLDQFSDLLAPTQGTNTELSTIDGPQALAVDGKGRTFAVSRQRLRVVDVNGEEQRSFPVPMSSSVAVLQNGDVAVASATVHGLIHIFSPLGAERGKIGQLSEFDPDPAQNRFLNQGIVLAGPDGEILYVLKHAPEITVRRYAGTGALVGEFGIDGPSLQAHLQELKGHLSTRRTGTVGGFVAIAAAAYDNQRGSVFIATTARQADWESIYEYGIDGVKRAEYSLFSNATTHLSRISDLAVRAGRLFAIAEGRLYSFDLPSSQFLAAHVRRIPIAVGFTARLSLSSVVTAKEACPETKNMQSCAVTNCGQNIIGVNCTATYAEQINPLHVIEDTCSLSARSCTYSAKTCYNDVTIGHDPITLNCQKDDDGDGWTPDTGEDCDDTNPDIHPGAYIGSCEETGNTDINCNGVSDDAECQTPIVIDIFGNGFRLTNKTSGVSFDLNGDGRSERLPWTASSSDDAWLAMDRNGNGRIDSGKELFGAPTAQPPSASPNGYIALAEFDRVENGGNSDELIDRQDPVFAKLLLWRDANHDGVSQESELLPPGASAIDAIDLNYREYQGRDEYGNWFRYKSEAKGIPAIAVARWTCDVYLWGKP